MSPRKRQLKMDKNLKKKKFHFFLKFKNFQKKKCLRYSTETCFVLDYYKRSLDERCFEPAQKKFQKKNDPENMDNFFIFLFPIFFKKIKTLYF